MKIRDDEEDKESRVVFTSDMWTRYAVKDRGYLRKKTAMYYSRFGGASYGRSR